MASHEIDNIANRLPETITTPEGDNESLPDEPLVPSAIDSGLQGLETPGGSGAVPSEQSEMTVLEKVLDEISHGTLLP